MQTRINKLQNSKKLFLITIIFILSLALNSLNAQKALTTKIYLAPTINIGYCFGSGISYGIDVTVGLFKIRNNPPEINGAISFQYYFINFDKRAHRIRTFNLIVESSYYRIGVGAGDVKLDWGFKRVNSNKSFGYAFDFGFNNNKEVVPWIGIKSFIPPPNTWEWYDKPNYIAFYTYFKHKPYYPFGE